MIRIRELRKEKKLSQKDLATQFHVAQNTISGWEKGIRDPDTDTVAALAAFFDVVLLTLETCVCLDVL